MNAQKLVFMLAIATFLAACQTTGSTKGQALAPGSEPSDVSQDNQEGVVQLDPQLPTGVHLQAAFQMPETLEGTPTVHDELRYLVYLPKGYRDDPEREWPLIFFLHGSGDEDYDSTFVLSFGLPAVLLAGEQPEDFPFVVISPQAFPGQAWWSPGMIPALVALLDDAVETYRVDTDRVYLTGLSMGGHGSWWLATAYPERFAAMASISGSGYRTPSLPEHETLCRLADLPIWAIHGAQDRISEAQASQVSAVALQQECSADVKWTLYEDEGHIGAYERAYRDPALYEWMLEHSR
ncbi:MAG: alpha/beta hydrolase-fold protein [Anaerolineales bacterium]